VIVTPFVNLLEDNLHHIDRVFSIVSMNADIGPPVARQGNEAAELGVWELEAGRSILPSLLFVLQGALRSPTATVRSLLTVEESLGGRSGGEPGLPVPKVLEVAELEWLELEGWLLWPVEAEERRGLRATVMDHHIVYNAATAAGACSRNATAELRSSWLSCCLRLGQS